MVACSFDFGLRSSIFVVINGKTPWKIEFNKMLFLWVTVISVGQKIRPICILENILLFCIRLRLRSTKRLLCVSMVF